jgi:hypothetical protein
MCEDKGVRKMEGVVEKFGMKKLDEEKHEVRKLPDGRFAFVIDLGDPRKATSNLWVKKVKKVDTTKENGYAFEGDFIPRIKGKHSTAEVIIQQGELVVAVVEFGSWKHPGQVMEVFVALEDGVYVTAGRWVTKAEKIETVHKVAEILKEIRGGQQ